MFEPLLTIKIKVMKNLMQKLVKATLCLGVVSVSLIACESDNVEQNIIDLDQIDDHMFDLDSLVKDSLVIDDTVEFEPVDENLIVEDEVKEEE